MQTVVGYHVLSVVVVVEGMEAGQTCDFVF